MNHKTHELKTWPRYYRRTISGKKMFEIRFNDRGFHVGDTLLLREFKPGKKEYTGRQSSYRVTYILRSGFGLPPQTVIMGIKPEAAIRSWQKDALDHIREKLAYKPLNPSPFLGLLPVKRSKAAYKEAAKRVELKELGVKLPPGYEIVTEGTTDAGDKVWNRHHMRWQPVDFINAYVSDYLGVCRKIVRVRVQ